MEILKYNEFCRINESNERQLDKPYSEIFLSEADLYQTYYDLWVISWTCGPDYEEKLKETFEPVFKFLGKCCEGLDYDLGLDIGFTVAELEKKYGVFSGDTALDRIAVPLANALKQKDYAEFDEIRCYARGLLAGIGEPYDASLAAETLGLSSPDIKKYIKSTRPVHKDSNELLKGNKGRTWEGMAVDEIRSFVKENNLPVKASIGFGNDDRLIFISANGKTVVSIEYSGCGEFSVADSSIYVPKPLSYGESRWKPMLDFLKKELVKIPTVVKEITVNGTEYRLEKENKGNIVTVCWNTNPKVKSMECSEWLKGTGEPGVYKTETEWDELDDAVAALGGKKLGKNKGYVVDDGDGKQQRFRTTYYDFSDVLK
jgi:hypothetical protein